MGRYRVLASGHTELDGRSYKTGDIVTSDLPLTEMFKNKFEKVFETKGKKKPSREEPESNEDDETDTEPDAAPEPVKSAKKEEEEDVPSEFGEDVTEEFPGAKEGQLRVFHDSESGHFTVVLAEKPTVSLSDSVLKSRKATLKCVSMNAVPA